MFLTFNHRKIYQSYHYLFFFVSRRLAFWLFKTPKIARFRWKKFWSLFSLYRSTPIIFQNIGFSSDNCEFTIDFWFLLWTTRRPLPPKEIWISQRSCYVRENLIHVQFFSVLFLPKNHFPWRISIYILSKPFELSTLYFHEFFKMSALFFVVVMKK